MVHLLAITREHTHSRDSLRGSLDEVWDLELLLHDHPVAAPARVVVRPVLVPHLPAALATPVLPTLREAGVIIGPGQGGLGPSILVSLFCFKKSKGMTIIFCPSVNRLDIYWNVRGANFSIISAQTYFRKEAHTESTNRWSAHLLSSTQNVGT